MHFVNRKGNPVPSFAMRQWDERQNFVPAAFNRISENGNQFIHSSAMMPDKLNELSILLVGYNVA